MSRLIAKLPDDSIIEFDSGSFDGWCVYLKRPNKTRYAPKDTQYFTILKQLGSIYGNQEIYDDFVAIYNCTTSVINNSVVEKIIDISLKYGKYANEICIWFAVIYAGMVAEENKKGAILKKRIKRLGLYQVLIDGLDPVYAANFSRGKKWRELDMICSSKGF
ncbi:MAG: hypothetical protein HQK71_04805 [Desulfamplus sp.]|nr:hypothetical protein [Desulfamplus sp.]